MEGKSLQKSLIGIAGAAAIGAMSSGAMAPEEDTDWRVGKASPPFTRSNFYMIMAN
jgi:hypothetical protein